MKKNKTVLITGCSSGIGRACALSFDRLGYTVYATVRKESDAQQLVQQASNSLKPLILDVSDFAAIERIGQELNEQLSQTGLDILINNAGMADFTPVEAIGMEQLKYVFDCNFFGAVRLTQVVLPLLRQAKGRIINISSVGGLTTIPFGFALCASKHALESFTAGLRLELMPWGIEVIAINPSSIATPASAKMVSQIEGIIQKMSLKHQEFYSKSMMQMGTSMSKAEAEGITPEEVAKVIVKAAESKKPCARYPVGPNSRVITTMSGLLPDRLFDRLKLKLVGIRIDS